MFSFDFQIDPKKFDKKDIEKLRLIERVKKFNRNIGLKETKNFTKFKEADERLSEKCGFLNDVLPFSYMDPSYVSIGDKTGIRFKNYIIKTNEYSAVANGSLVTRSFLDSADEDIVETVIHEDFHDSVSLPRHLDEAAAYLVGIVGGVYFRLGTKKISEAKSMVKKELAGKILPENDCFEKLEVLYNKFSRRGISLRIFEKKRIRILNDIGYLSVDGLITMVFNRTYYYYFPLLFELLVAFNMDLFCFIDFFKKFPYKEPRGIGLGLFNETRRLELLAEECIKKEIKRLKK